MDSLALHLFGVIHVDRVPKVAAELEDYAVGEHNGTAPADGDDTPSPEAILVEYPTLDRLSPRVYLAALARAPAVLLGVFVLLFVHGVGYALVNRSLFPAEVLAARRVADRHDLPLHAVDRNHPTLLAADAGLGWTFPSYALLVGFAWWNPRGVALGVAALLVGAALLFGLFALHRYAFAALGVPVCLTGLAVLVRYAPLFALALVLVLLLTVGRLNARREDGMLDRASDLADAEGYEAAVLVTGKAHLPGLTRRAADRDDLRVIRAFVSKFLRSSDDLRPDGVDAGARRPTPRPDSARDALGRRYLAAAVDAAVALALAAVVGFLAFAVAATAGSTGAGVVVGLLTVLLIPPLYHATLERHFGRTLGKGLLGLVVADADAVAAGGEGTDLSATQPLVRTLLWPVDALTLGLFAVASERHQRLGDLVAGTVVLRTASEE
jgi:uncharacterized RDD family membrane protein YckC